MAKTDSKKDNKPAEWTSKYNPFNSDKLMAQIPRWEGIQRWKYEGGALPPPTTVSVDPSNICDLRCDGCNASEVMHKNPRSMISKEGLEQLADFLGQWEVDGFKVKSVCGGGGGEPLINPHTSDFINRATQNGLKVGVVTNGTQIHNHLDALVKCDWVGVSVDAAYQHTYKKVKGADKFPQVIKNIRELVKASQGAPYVHPLGDEGNGRGVFFKYLLRPETVNEVYYAAKLAKSLGCRGMHIRPIAPPWGDLEKAAAEGATIPNRFSDDDISRFRKRLTSARELEDDKFHIYGVTHKFDGTFAPTHDFKSCNAAYMSMVVMPPSSTFGGAQYDITTCCDRRGDDTLTAKNLMNAGQIANYWGSEVHRYVAETIDVTKCPRCTFSPHQKIFENAVEVDNMTTDFI